MRLWSLLGHLPRSRQVVWHFCALAVWRLRQFEAIVQECTTDFEMLSWPGHDDCTFGVMIYGVFVLENQERWQMGDDAMYTL